MDGYLYCPLREAEFRPHLLVWRTVFLDCQRALQPLEQGTFSCLGVLLP